jgi:hypothetical protein
MFRLLSSFCLVSCGVRESSAPPIIRSLHLQDPPAGGRCLHDQHARPLALLRVVPGDGVLYDKKADQRSRKAMQDFFNETFAK